VSKFEEKRLEAQRKLEEELEKIAESERAHQRKIIKPVVSKISALLAEEVEKFGVENIEALEAYRFVKADLRERLRSFVESEFKAELSE